MTEFVKVRQSRGPKTEILVSRDAVERFPQDYIVVEEKTVKASPGAGEKKRGGDNKEDDNGA